MLPIRFDRLNIGDVAAVTLTDQSWKLLSRVMPRSYLPWTQTAPRELMPQVNKSKLGGGYGGYKWDNSGWQVLNRTLDFR